MENMSDEEKRRVAGQCNYTLVTLFSTAAFICGVYGNSDCNFARRTLNFAEGVDPDTVCNTTLVGGDVCETLVEPHGIGFYSWYAVVPVNQEVCLSYTIYLPDVGYATPGFDTKFNSAKALGVAANVFGFMAWMTLMLASCCPLSQQRLKGLSCYFCLATLFQGLTFLLWRSNACDVGFFSAYFPEVDDVSGVITGVDCGLATGSKLAISATVCYFMCMCLIPAAVAPPPVGGMGAPQDQQAAATDEEAN